MNKILGKIMMVILAAGVTAATANAQTNGFTNIIRTVSINLKVFQQYVPGGTAANYGTPAFGGTNTLGTKLVDHVSTLTTKNIIAALEAATGSNWAPNPQLVLVSIFTNGALQGSPLTNGSMFVATALTNDASTNGLSTNGNIEIDFVPVTVDYGTSNAFAFAVGGTVLITNIGGTLIASNTAGTVTPDLGNFFPSAITNGGFVYNNPNNVLTFAPIETNAGIWTTLTATASTNGGRVITNLVVTTFTNVLSTNNNNNREAPSKMEVMFGPANSPSFADVSSYISISANGSQFNESGHDIGATNPAISITNIQTQSAVGITRASLNYFVPVVGSTTNLTGLTLSGFGTTTLKTDTLAAKKGTNAAVLESIVATTVANVSGTGMAEGAYETNTNIIGNEIGVSESIGTNTVSGSLSNAIPIVVEGTITIGGLKNLSR